MDDEVSFKVRFALAESFGPNLAYSELGDELCAFGEQRYGLESTLEVLEQAEGDLLSAAPQVNNRQRC